MNLRNHLKPLIWILASILSFSFLFLALRFFEILLHREYLLFSYPLKDTFFRFLYSFSADFIFFFIFNLPYLFFYFICEWLHKDKNCFFRKTFFRITHLFLLLVFFIDMQTIAVQGRLFHISLLSAFNIEMLINSWLYGLDYWYLVLAFLISSFVLFKYLPLILKQNVSKKQIKLSLIASLCLTVLCLGAFTIMKVFPFQKEQRYNGLLKRLLAVVYPLKCDSVFFSKKELLRHLKAEECSAELRNSTALFCLAPQKNPKMKNSNKMITAEPLLQKKPVKTKENIILFVIESLHKSLLNPKLMPFLSGLRSKGISFENHLSPSYNATSLSVSALMTGKPNNSLLDKEAHFLSAFFQAGYNLSFFFGDSKNTYNWSGFFSRLGISQVFKEDYLKDTGRKEDIDTEGNVFEDVFLKYSAEKLKSGAVGPPPFFAVLLTNQIHAPYYCSRSVNINYPEERKIKDCVQHVDTAIKDFFKEIQTAEWFYNTLFVFTADHSSYQFWENNVDYFLERNIPLVFYHPNKDLSRYQNNQASSHIDIIPSLKDYLKLPYHKSLIQNSIFDLNRKRRFFMDTEEGFVLIEDDYLTEYNCQSRQSTTYLKGQRGKDRKAITDQEIIKRQDRLIKSYIQYDQNLKDH